MYEACVRFTATSGEPAAVVKQRQLRVLCHQLKSKFRGKGHGDCNSMVAGARDTQCTTEDNLPLNHLEKFDARLRMPQPDKHYGARPSQIDPKVRADTGEYIIPSTHTTLPAAPTTSWKVKARQGALTCCSGRSCMTTYTSGEQYSSCRITGRRRRCTTAMPTR